MILFFSGLFVFGLGYFPCSCPLGASCQCPGPSGALSLVFVGAAMMVLSVISLGLSFKRPKGASEK